MRKIALLLVALCLVIGMSGAAWADHTVQLVDDGFPVGIEGVNVRFHILTEFGWQTFDMETDGDGIATDPHFAVAAGVFWWAEVCDTQWDDTQTGQINYPTMEADLELDEIPR